ncbi:MAG: hypothetical protein C4530_15420 [Desulfobacteraceae bacterium]|nr:MAG: hypothetical protein C4530_15420 [Desulfobacteraceae bacterium]
MPIESVKQSYNPLNTLAWATSIAMLALTRIANGKDIDISHQNALGEVKQKTQLLHRESQLDSEDYLNGSLASSEELIDPFLFAFSSKDYYASKKISEEQLAQAVVDLDHIVGMLNTNMVSQIEPTRIQNARNFCSNLLSLLNSQPDADDLVTKTKME